MKVKVKNGDDLKKFIINSMARQSLIPIVGAGVSIGAHNASDCVLSGAEYKKLMIKEINKSDKYTDAEKGQIKDYTFTALCDVYEDNEVVPFEIRRRYFKNHFYNVHYAEGDIRRNLYEIEWPYIYSLNIDDAIENSTKFDKIIKIDDNYIRDDYLKENHCIIKLHGDINDILKCNEPLKVFTTKEYLKNILNNVQLKNRLKDDFQNQNIIFIGCSLDEEIDLMTASSMPDLHFKIALETLN